MFDHNLLFHISGNPIFLEATSNIPRIPTVVLIANLAVFTPAFLQNLLEEDCLVWLKDEDKFTTYIACSSSYGSWVKLYKHFCTGLKITLSKSLVKSKYASI